MGWTILVLITKGTTNTKDINLLETLWKVVEALIKNFLCASLHMHNVLNGFRGKRGTGTAIMEVKLAQELASIDYEFLLLLLLDLHKAYDTVYRDRLLIKMEGYGAGPQMCGLLETFWYCQ